jgi:hypothetical protein
LGKFRKVFSLKNWRVVARFIRDAMRAGFAPRFRWGQDGEDVFLVDSLPKKGFYVDVGAHHPYRFSSTKLLYDRGWSGLNIDVTEAIRTSFPSSRPRDTFHYGLIGKSRQATFFRFVEPALSTLDETLATERMASGCQLLSKETFTVEPLEDVLVKHRAPREIDLLCVDAEGADLEVLETVNFSKRDIARVLVEVHTPAWKLHEHPIAVFLEKQGFRPVAVWLRSALFERVADES